MFLHIDQFPLSLLFWGKLPEMSIIVCHISLIIFMSLHWTYCNMSVSPLLWPQNLSQHSAWVSLGLRRWQGLPSLPYWKCCLPNISQVLLPFLCCRGTAFAHLQFVHRFLRSFSEKLLWWFSWLSPSMYLSREFFLPRYKTWHLPFLNYIKFLLSICSSLLRSLCAAAKPSSLSDLLPSFVKQQTRTFLWKIVGSLLVKI